MLKAIKYLLNLIFVVCLASVIATVCAAIYVDNEFARHQSLDGEWATDCRLQFNCDYYNKDFKE